MPSPVFVIVGRPNVGKSTFFNRLVGRRDAIVQAEPGVTRDRRYGEGKWEGSKFLAVDTGGIAASEGDPFLPKIQEQTAAAIAESEVVLFLVDGIEGFLPGDHEIAQMLRVSKKPVLLILNKSDAKRARETEWDFYQLGLGDVWPVSAEHGSGVSEVMDEAIRIASRELGSEEAKDTDEHRIAVVGRPNVGKSSFVNQILGSERTLVSPVPGTTRDPVDSLCLREGKSYRLVDTAGIRRRGKIGKRQVEAVSMIMAYRSIERAQVALLLIDATEGPKTMDAQIARHIKESGRACAILLNKWDLIEKESKTFDGIVREIKDKLVHIHFAPVLSVSALTGQRCERVFDVIDKIFESHLRRVPTGQLNRAIAEIVAAHPPPTVSGGRRPKVFYATQSGVSPPHVILFASLASQIPVEQYGRYVERRLRERFDFEGTPLRVSFRQRGASTSRRRRGKARR
ncbi:MAG: ribosome biogenesis GTPase Der [Nitrospinae bacterium]|nr:ribosome biogenesis GTPase Der [Nitrospinota bacterium]